jgi:hypothetical protein
MVTLLFFAGTIYNTEEIFIDVCPWFSHCGNVRDMQVGYNTNIPYKGKVYHVQTEDTGLESLHIISLLYYKGAILASKKLSYAHLKDLSDFKGKVRELMKEQHKGLIKELLAGKFSGQSAESESILAAGEDSEVKEKKSLDDILIEFIINRAGKK